MPPLPLIKSAYVNKHITNNCLTGRDVSVDAHYVLQVGAANGAQ